MPAGSSTSCSSAMSPTISSMMSSRVTRPCSAPYSSTTRAKWERRRRNSRSWSSRVVDLGDEVGLHRHVHDVEPLEDAGAAAVVGDEAVDGAREILGVDDADDVLGLAAEDRDAGVGRVDRLREDLAGGSSASIISMSRRCIITSSTWRSPKSSALEPALAGLVLRGLGRTGGAPPRRPGAGGRVVARGGGRWRAEASVAGPSRRRASGGGGRRRGRRRPRGSRPRGVGG